MKASFLPSDDIITSLSLLDTNDPIDYQGIRWFSMFGTTRSTSRASRSIGIHPNLSDGDIERALKKYPSRKKLKKSAHRFDFTSFFKDLEPKCGHYQLHHNLFCQSYHDLYYLGQNDCVNSFCTIRKKKKSYPNANLNPTCLAVSKNLYALGGHEGNIELFNLKNSDSIYHGTITEDGGAHITNHVAFSDDDGSSLNLLVSSNDCTLKIFDLANGLTNPIFKFSKSTAINFAKVSPFKPLIATYSDQREPEIIDKRSSEVVMSLKGHEDYGFCVDWHPIDENIIASGNQDATTRIWDLRNPKTALHVIQSEKGSVYCVKYSPDGEHLAIGETIDFVSLYKHNDGYKDFQLLDFFGVMTGLDWSKANSLFIGVSVRNFDGIFEWKEKSSKLSKIEEFFI